MKLSRTIKQLIAWAKKSSKPESEINFWDQWFLQEGVTSPDKAEIRHKDYLDRQNPDTELQEQFRNLLEIPADESIKILDVGAGPLTIIGKRWGNRRIQISSVDFLAEAYESILAKYKIVPLVRTEYAMAEQLSAKFNPNTFDLVYARNSIDHTKDPIQAIIEMLTVAKPNHYVLMEHLANEGINQKYQGLHQWNFFIEDQQFMVGRGRKVTNLSDLLSDLAEVECEWINPQWIRTTLKKPIQIDNLEQLTDTNEYIPNPS